MASNFFWYDLMTTDVASASKFYSSVVGWITADSGMPGMNYTIFSTGGVGVAGLMPLPTEAGAPKMPVWSVYVHVIGVDDYASKVVDAGGAILLAPSDIPGVGRFAVVADPTGAAFEIMEPNGERPDLPALAPKQTGTIGWHELQAGDGRAAFDFYARVFGWSQTGTFDMGPMGEYILFATDKKQVGGMMTKQPQVPHPFWLSYFYVDGIDAAAERIAKSGGKVVNGPTKVPGDEWVLHATDPQGGFFALVSETK